MAIGPEMEAVVEQLMGMGFDREQVIAALRAAFFNPDRAVDYLINVIFYWEYAWLCRASPRDCKAYLLHRPEEIREPKTATKMMRKPVERKSTQSSSLNFRTWFRILPLLPWDNKSGVILRSFQASSDISSKTILLSSMYALSVFFLVLKDSSSARGQNFFRPWC